MVIIETDSTLSYSDPVVYHSYKFHSKIQQPDEPFDEYLSAITELAKLCQFESLEERMIRDKIVVGINCSSLRERLLQLKDTKLNNVVECCRSVEKEKNKGNKDSIKKLLQFRKRGTPEKKLIFEVNLEDSLNDDENFNADKKNVPGGAGGRSTDGVTFVDVKMEGSAGFAGTTDDSGDGTVDVNVKEEMVEEDADADYDPDSMDQDECFNNDDDMIDINTNIKTEPGESEDCEMPGEGTPPISDDDDERPVVIPPRSKDRYATGFENFLKWQKETNRENVYTEEVLMTYFLHLSATFSPNTLWSCFSMLKKMLKINRKINIQNYKKLINFIKTKNKGYKSKQAKVFKMDEIVKFLNEARDDDYLHCKVVTVFGIIGGCRTSEMVSIRLSDVEFHGKMMVVNIPACEGHAPRSFTVCSDYYDIVKNYIDARPKKVSCDRFFLQYRHGKCKNQPIGKNTFSRMPELIAKFLNLENAEEYTGYSFRSSSKKLLASTGADVFTLKRHGYRRLTDLPEKSEDKSSKVTKEPESEATEDSIPASPGTLEISATSSSACEVIKEADTSQPVTFNAATLNKAVRSSIITPKITDLVDQSKPTETSRIASESIPVISNPRSLNKFVFVPTGSRVTGETTSKPVFVVKTRASDRNRSILKTPGKINPNSAVIKKAHPGIKIVSAAEPRVTINPIKLNNSSTNKSVFLVKTRASDKKVPINTPKSPAKVVLRGSSTVRKLLPKKLPLATRTPPFVVMDDAPDSNLTQPESCLPVISNVTSLKKSGFVVVNNEANANLVNSKNAGEMVLGTPSSAILATPSTSVAGTSGKPRFVLKGKVPDHINLNQLVNFTEVNKNVQDESGHVSLANCTVHFNFYPNLASKINNNFFKIQSAFSLRQVNQELLPNDAQVTEPNNSLENNFHDYFQNVDSAVPGPSEEIRGACTNCQTEFHTVSDLESHLSVCQNPNKNGNNFKMMINKNFQFIKKNLDKSNPTTTKIFQCNICSKFFKKEQSLRNHYISHYNDGRCKCEVCGKTFGFPSELKHHSVVHNEKKPYKCITCLVSFKEAKTLKMHMTTHSSKKPHKCGVCGKTFARKVYLTTHSAIHTGKKPYECKVCPRKFGDVTSLKRHLLIHSGEKPYKCNICDKPFREKGALRKHVFIHSVDKPFKCNDCGKAYAQKASLKSHEVTHTGVLPFKCEICDSTFRDKAGLTSHSFLHTGEIPYKCEHCDKAYRDKTTYKRHLVVHMEESPYKCKVCGKTFRGRNNLKHHLFIHTGEKPYVCNDCDRPFRSKSTLKEHMYRIHKSVEIDKKVKVLRKVRRSKRVLRKRPKREQEEIVEEEEIEVKEEILDDVETKELGEASVAGRSETESGES